MEDGELRQAIAVLESYNAQLEAMTRQVSLLRISFEEATRARESMKAIAEAKEGDDILVPVGASSFVPAKIGDKKAIVNVGSRISVEKSLEDAIAFMDASSKEISEALRKAVSALEELEGAATELSMAIQNEYDNRQNVMQ